MVDLPDCGRKLALPLVDDGELQADDEAQAGTGWLPRRGHGVVWVGWQGDIPLDRSGRNLGLSRPLPTDGGRPMIGTSLEETVFDAPGTKGTMPLSYAAVHRLRVRRAADAISGRRGTNRNARRRSNSKARTGVPSSEALPTVSSCHIPEPTP